MDSYNVSWHIHFVMAKFIVLILPVWNFCKVE